jgi:hypothetical protein
MNYWKNLNILLSPEGEGGGGESAEDASKLEKLAGEEEEHGEEGTEAPEEKEEVKPQPSLTKDDVTQILASVIPAAMERAKPAEQERQYTKEEIDKMLNVWNPDVGFLKKMGIAEPTAENLAALTELRDGLIRQANTMTDARLRQYVKEQLTEFEDVRQYVSERRAAEVLDNFYGKNPDLKDYEEIVDAVSSRLEKNGLKGTQDQVFTEVAKGAREVLKRMNVKAPAAGAKPASNGSASRMSRLAGSGSSGSTTAPKKRNPDMAIFDEPED